MANLILTNNVKLDGKCVNNFSYVGMVIFNTLETEAEVKNIFGDDTSWTKIEDKFILGASETYPLNSTGGEAEHQLTIDEMPRHSHELFYQNTGANGGAAAPTTSGIKYTTGYTGGNQAHNNMPPYLAINIRQRIS